MHMADRLLVGKPERCRYRRGDNIKMDHQELEWQSMNWINMTQDVVNLVMNRLVL